MGIKPLDCLIPIVLLIFESTYAIVEGVMLLLDGRRLGLQVLAHLLVLVQADSDVLLFEGRRQFSDFVQRKSLTPLDLFGEHLVFLVLDLELQLGAELLFPVVCEIRGLLVLLLVVDGLEIEKHSLGSFDFIQLLDAQPPIQAYYTIPFRRIT